MPLAEVNAGMVPNNVGRLRRWKPTTDAVGNALPAPSAEAFGITPVMHTAAEGAQRTAGLTGADIEHLVDCAVLLAIKEAVARDLPHDDGKVRWAHLATLLNARS